MIYTGMTPIVYACVAVALVIIIYTITRPSAKTTPGCTRDSECPISGQTCDGGICHTPPSSCYEWTPWDGTAGTSSAPSGIVGAGGGRIPVSKLIRNDPKFGYYDDDHNTMMYVVPPYGFSNNGVLDTKNLYSAVATGGSCPTTFQSTKDPAKALQFRGKPVCWNFKQNSYSDSTYYPYLNGACVGFDDYDLSDVRLIKNVPANI